jgi:hypothetical protein
MRTTAAFAFLLALAGTSSAQDAILYDTFNENDPANLFDCCNSLPIAGRHAGVYSSVGLTFTVPAKTKIREFDIPLSWMSGRSKFIVKVSGPHINHHWEYLFTDVPPGGQCCVFMMTTGAIPVVAGTYTLRVVAWGAGSLIGGWNLNTAGATGDYITWDQDGKHEQNGVLPALRILTRP